MCFALRLSVLLFALPISLFGQLPENVGLYIGSFDPPTLGHLKVLLGARKGPVPLAKIYVSVNHATNKDFNLSVAERVELFEALVEDLGDSVAVLREPLEGRPETARYLLDRHQGKLLGIFGDDTFEKNYQIFTTKAQLHDFDYIKVLRPQVATESVTSSIYEIEIDAEGLSSSLARDLIQAGKDPVAAGVLSPRIYQIIKERGYYAKPDPAAAAQESRAFAERYAAFETEMRKRTPELFTGTTLIAPSYKPGQTREGQNDKFIRQMIESLKLPLERQWAFRREAETYLGVRAGTRPLRLARKAGAFLGSFDPFNEGQKDSVRKMIRENQLDDFYIGVLETSRKPILRSVRERIELIKQELHSVGALVHIEPVASLADSHRWFRRIANEHETPTNAFFGSNVFQDNAQRLADLPRVVPKQIDVPQLEPVVETTCAESFAERVHSSALPTQSVTHEAFDPQALEWFTERLAEIF